jgi:hypothetical protein
MTRCTFIWVMLAHSVHGVVCPEEPTRLQLNSEFSSDFRSTQIQVQNSVQFTLDTSETYRFRNIQVHT